MGLEVSYEGNFSQVMSWMDEKAKQRMMEAIQAVHKQTVENLSGQRSGRMYYVPGTRRKYQASAPGEFPAVQLGTLRKTLKRGVEGEQMDLQGFVGSDQKYAPMLEFGTHHKHTVMLNTKSGFQEKVTLGGWNVAPRPWLRRTFEAMNSKIQDILRRPWE